MVAKLTVGHLKNDVTGLRNEAQSLGVAQRRINEIMRTAGHNAGKWWVNNCLPRHFTNVAYSMYGYRRRSWRTTRQKMYAPSFFDPNQHRYVKNPFEGKPTLPLVRTGSLRDYVLGARSFFQIKATSKFASAEQKQIINVRIPIGLNHPINHVNSGELTRLANSEWRQMRSMMFAEIKNKIRKVMWDAIRRKAS